MTGTTRQNIFKLKRSNVSGKIPTTSDLLVGELAINTQDGFLYTSIANTGGTNTVEVRQIGWDRLSILSGGTVNGNVIVNGSLSATTYYNVPTVFGASFNGAGGTLATGNTIYTTMAYNGTITGWDLIGSPTGSCIVDIWKTSSGLPTTLNSITDNTKPTINNNSTATSSTLSGWTTTYSAGDKVGFNINSVSGFTTLTLTIRGYRA